MIPDYDYFPEHEVRGEIHAIDNDDEHPLERWRIDASGTQWYRRRIVGTPMNRITPSVAAIEPDEHVDYVSSLQLSDEHYELGIETGALEAWHTTANGNVWFRFRPALLDANDPAAQAMMATHSPGYVEDDASEDGGDDE